MQAQQVKISPVLLLNAHGAIKNNWMSIRKKSPTRLAAGLLLAIVIDTALQLVWKSAVLSLPNDGSPWLNMQAVLHDPLFVFA